MKQLKWLLMPVCALLFVGVTYFIAEQNRLAQQPDLPDRPNADTAIAYWQARVGESSDTYLEYTLLGESYQRKARETGAVDFYQRAEAAFRKALEINPEYPPASLGLAGSLFAMHDFEGAIEIAEPFLALPKVAPSALAIIGDAELALGHYEEAEAAYDQLAQTAPGASTNSRLAFFADMQGRTDEAMTLLQEATDAAWQAADYRENLAWYEFQLGEMNFKNGHLAEAEMHYQSSLKVFENYYLGLSGMGKVRAAQGKYDEAIKYYEQVVAIIPQPDFLATLGDLYGIQSKPELAQQQYDTIAFIGKLAEVNEQVYNRQLAIFYADHDIELDKALELTAAELEARQDILGYDAAAWAYYKNGQYETAQGYMTEAMKLGTRDAKLYYHAGMIAQALGNAAEAQSLLSEALQLNPHFDIMQAPLAQAALNQLLTSN
jgi:tetratricopeptide (TPR) repeat protein